MTPPALRSDRCAKSTGRAIAGAYRVQPMTYSIVARDPTTGELGVAVQSRRFVMIAPTSVLIVRPASRRLGQ